MRPRTLLVLFALAAVLGAFIWFFERDLPSTDERAEQSKRLLSLEPASVQAIVLAAGERRLRLERAKPSEEGGGGSEALRSEWMLTEPLAGRAGVEEVESLLERMSDLEKERTLEAGSREEFELDQPRAEITVETGPGEIRLRFGAEVPASSNTIVEIGEGPPFYVVNATGLFEDVTREPNEWRSRDAIPIQRSSVERIEILKPANGVVLKRSGEQFRLVQPIEDLADETRVSALLTALVELEIEEFVDRPHEASGPDLVALRLGLAGGYESLLVEIDGSGGAGEATTVRVGGQEFRAETDLGSLIQLRPTDWQSTSWSDLKAYDVERFRLVDSAGERRFERRAGSWFRGDAEIEYSLAGDLLRALNDARGTPATGEVTLAGQPPKVEIDLESSAGKETLRLWSDSEGYLAGRSRRSTLIRLDSESTNEFFAKLEALDAAPDLDSESPSELTSEPAVLD